MDSLNSHPFLSSGQLQGQGNCFFFQFSANNYLTANQLLLNRQSGYQSFHSNVIALLEATDSWSLNVAHGLVNAVVLLDLRKVFDAVDQDMIFYGPKYNNIV